MRVAVAGGTGVVGRHVVASLARDGHQPVVLARSRGVDVTTGAGLDAAMTGVDVVVDVTGATAVRRRSAVEFFTAGTGNLLQAGRRAGVRHHVALSIVGVDRVDLGYYAAKRLQEQQVLAGPVAASVLRSTQFHEFVAQVLALSRGPLAVVPRMPIQPVAASEVGQALAGMALADPVGLAPELAGPDRHDLPDMARQVLLAQRSRRRVVPVQLPGRAGRAMAAGGLLPTAPGPRGGLGFTNWLAAGRPDSGGAPPPG